MDKYGAWARRQTLLWPDGATQIETEVHPHYKEMFPNCVEDMNALYQEISDKP